MQYKQYTMGTGLRQITNSTNKIDIHVDKIKDSHNAEKNHLNTKNRELAKIIHNLKKQLKDTQLQLQNTQKELEEARADLNTSRASIDIIFNFMGGGYPLQHPSDVQYIYLTT